MFWLCITFLNCVSVSRIVVSLWERLETSFTNLNKSGSMCSHNHYLWSHLTLSTPCPMLPVLTQKENTRDIFVTANSVVQTSVDRSRADSFARHCYLWAVSVNTQPRGVCEQFTVWTMKYTSRFGSLRGDILKQLPLRRPIHTFTAKSDSGLQLAC